MNELTVQYRFKLENQPDEIFNLKIDPRTLSLQDNKPESLPEWARLEFYQCPNCPLISSRFPYCPLASNLVNIVSRFNRFLSYDRIEVEIVSQERIISNFTTAQRGLRSLMGLIIAVSDCPHTVFFKPMARFHLPFSDEIETIYRATSMYLLAQYFIKKSKGKPDFKLKGLTRIYHNLHLVNTSIAHRLRKASQTDSTVNAIVLLDIFTKALPKAIEESLKEIQYLFTPFLEKTKKKGLFFKRKKSNKIS
ncbi:MAG: hypothetical protein KAT17_04775 [Candidatus Aminicenantes bacterium]|nr:hypothetical protein [Candidatus Aminicenantes bacterium]